jgi:DNA repair protein RadC
VFGFLFTYYKNQEELAMNQYRNEELKKLISESLREQLNSYHVLQLFEQFPTTSELLDASEEQLIHIKGIGKGKARQIRAILELARTLTAPSASLTAKRSGFDPSKFHQ